MLARPVRSAVLLGKWLAGGSGSGFVVLAGLAMSGRVLRRTTGRHNLSPHSPCSRRRRSPLTLGLLLSTMISPMASGVVVVGLSGDLIAGVGGVGEALGNAAVARVGTTRGCRRRPTACGVARCTPCRIGLRSLAGSVFDGFPFLSRAPADRHLPCVGRRLGGDIWALAAVSSSARTLTGEASVSPRPESGDLEGDLGRWVAGVSHAAAPPP